MYLCIRLNMSNIIFLYNTTIIFFCYQKSNGWWSTFGIMFIPTPVRRAILRSLFENGILVVSSDQAAKHEELGCLNIYPYQLGRSFVSRGYCKKQYAWSHIYYILTDKGIEYLRGYFGAPANVQPATMQPRDKTAILERSAREGRPNRGRGGFHGGRSQGDGERSPRRNFRGNRNETRDAEATPAQE